MTRHILLSVDAGVGTVTFNRPSRLNAIDVEMARGMRELAQELPRRSDVRVWVLRGEGPAFMAGGDVELFQGDPDAARATISSLIDHFHTFTIALQELPQPVIASVRGPVAGGGFSLALGADITIASETATFRSAYIRLGTSPDGGATFFLPRLVGPKRALEILLSSEALTAADAERAGIVNRVVPDADLDRETRVLAERLAANAPLAAAHTKALLRRPNIAALKEQLAAERAAFLDCVGSREFSEGVRSFLSKRVARASTGTGE